MGWPGGVMSPTDMVSIINIVYIGIVSVGSC